MVSNMNSKSEYEYHSDTVMPHLIDNMKWVRYSFRALDGSYFLVDLEDNLYGAIRYSDNSKTNFLLYLYRTNPRSNSIFKSSRYISLGTHTDLECGKFIIELKICEEYPNVIE